MKKWICDECGSDKVQSQYWVDLNTGETQGMVSDEAADNWCEGCQQHVDVVFKTFKKPKKK